MWSGYIKPFKIFGNLYFVGILPASTHLIDTGDGELSQLNRKLPFSGESEPLAQEFLSADFCGECRVSELTLDVGDQSVDVTADILPEIRGSGVAEVEYTADVYSTEYNCGNTYCRNGVWN